MNDEARRPQDGSANRVPGTYQEGGEARRSLGVAAWGQGAGKGKMAQVSEVFDPDGETVKTV